jgi:hypothetical protein
VGASQGQDRKRPAQAAVQGGLHVPAAGIQPLHGVRSKVGWINAIYFVSAPLLGYLTRVAPHYMTTSERLGRAMIKVARDGYPKKILESEDINSI